MKIAKMAKTGMLVVTNPNKFVRIVPLMQNQVKNTLYVHIAPSKIEPISNHSLGPYFSPWIANLYHLSVPLRNLDIRVLLSTLKDPSRSIKTKLPVEVVYFDSMLNREEMDQFILRNVLNRTSDCKAVALETSDIGPEISIQPEEDFRMYDNVVLGGTFDRLHCGHKLLLSEAVLRCRKMLTVGVTSTAMLMTKKLWELIEPCELRINKVRDFLEDIEPNLEYVVIPIDDMYGPTKDDPSFEMIVVSSETLRGGTKVNELREKNKLNKLEVHYVDLLPDVKMDDIEEEKISSSNDRLRKLGTLLKVPEPRPHIPHSPYIVGLSGGIAAGKTTICNKLESLGAAVINCDKIGHSIYAKGTPGYNIVVDHFGSSIIGEDKEIDRKKLGAIVFSNDKQLQKLNDLLWPLILQEAKLKINEAAEAGFKVVVMEAAVLIQAGWINECHEVWTCIVPPEEAVKRIMSRGLNEEEANARISAQPSNCEFVANANVVFCSLWTHSYTGKQVERAWKDLLTRIISSNGETASAQ